jgi:hypothetical protein
MLVYDTTVSQVKVKTSSSTASYTAVGAGAAQKVQGTYVGDGTTNRGITVGFTPDLVVVSSGAGASPAAFGVLHRTEQTYSQVTNGGTVSSSAYVITNGFNTVSAAPLNTNTIGYAWTAFKFV